MLVSVTGARGSTPRATDAKMVVSGADTFATIGGGQLEYRCVQLARELLAEEGVYRLQEFALGPSLGQCCGGVATVSFERIEGGVEWPQRVLDLWQSQQPLVLAGMAGARRTNIKFVITADAVHGSAAKLDVAVVSAARGLLACGRGSESRGFTGPLGGASSFLLEAFHPYDFQVVLFGAGHVGRALVEVLAGLPCWIRWVDGRDDAFPREAPANVECVHAPAPEYEVDAAPAGAFFLVMTHSHPLDQAICERILQRDDFRYCGLIGSVSKRKRFEKRFRAAGIPDEVRSKLTCPIGVPGISGKRPAEIAVAVTAQLLRVNEGYNAEAHGDRGAKILNPQRLAS